MAWRWSDAEREELSFLAGNVPSDRLCRSYNHWASCNGYPLRTRLALVVMAGRLRLSLRTYGSYVTPGLITSLLPFSAQVCDRWIRLGWLPVYRPPGSRHRYIARADLVAFARARPLELAGCSYEVLMQLLEDHALAVLIAGFPSRRANTPKAVLCVESGRVYPSICAAARAHYVVHRAITWAIETGNCAAGRHWTWPPDGHPLPSATRRHQLTTTTHR
jgi:hypothetical protein